MQWSDAKLSQITKLTKHAKLRKFDFNSQCSVTGSEAVWKLQINVREFRVLKFGPICSKFLAYFQWLCILFLKYKYFAVFYIMCFKVQTFAKMQFQ